LSGEDDDQLLKPHVVAYKPSNSSIILGEHYFLKVYRNPQEGENTDVELVKNLTRHSTFKNLPPYVGRLDYKRPDFEDTTLALMVDLIPNVEDAWKMTQTAIETFFDKVLSEDRQLVKECINTRQMEEFIEPFFLEMADLLGERTADMHKALTGITQVKGFEPEPFSLLYQKSLYQAMRTFTKRNFSWIQNHINDLDEENRELLIEIIHDQDEYFTYIQNILEKKKINALKTRVHGNFKLNKLLFTGKDFIITDYEGEVEFLLSVRKLKHCPLKDVASMLGSINYAIHKGYFHRKEFMPVDENFLRPLLDNWYEIISTAFLNGYFRKANQEKFIPENREEAMELLNLYIFERSVQEIRRFAEHDHASLIVPVKSMRKIISK
jgi:maltose alpha-D-glucosyltransferase / alpha-amylase